MTIFKKSRILDQTFVSINFTIKWSSIYLYVYIIYTFIFIQSISLTHLFSDIFYQNYIIRDYIVCKKTNLKQSEFKRDRIESVLKVIFFISGYRMDRSFFSRIINLLIYNLYINNNYY